MGSIPGLGRSSGGGSGNPLQYSCLENPLDRGAWRAIVHGIAKSQIRLSDRAHTRIQAPWRPGSHLTCLPLYAHYSHCAEPSRFPVTVYLVNGQMNKWNYSLWQIALWSCPRSHSLQSLCWFSYHTQNYFLTFHAYKALPNQGLVYWPFSLFPLFALLQSHCLFFIWTS